MENTKYSNSSNAARREWLESWRAGTSYHVWVIATENRNVGYDYPNVSDSIGVRPAIEVAKTDISY